MARLLTVAALLAAWAGGGALANVSAYADFNRHIAAEGLSGYVSSAGPCDRDPARACLTATARWPALPRGRRLDVLRGLWEAWAALCTRYGLARAADACRITLRTDAGGEIGGSRAWAGSALWLAD